MSTESVIAVYFSDITDNITLLCRRPEPRGVKIGFLLNTVIILLCLIIFLNNHFDFIIFIYAIIIIKPFFLLPSH